MPKKNSLNKEKGNGKSTKQKTSGGHELSKAAYTIADSLARLLEDVLNSGLVVAGDVKLKVADLELLLKLRLIVTTINKAQDLGIDWWNLDRFYTTSETARIQGLQNRQIAAERQLQESRQKTPKSKKRRKPKKRK